MKRLLGLTIILLGSCTSTFAQEQAVIERAHMYESYIAEASAKHGVDSNLLWTIAYLESRFRPGLTSPKGAMGLMQFIPATAARYGLNDPYNPEQSIDAAARYFRDLIQRFDGRLELVLAAYNAGEQSVIAFRDGRTITLPNGKVINPAGRKTGGVPPYLETENYVSNGLAVYRRLKGQITNTPESIHLNNKENKPNLPDLESAKQKSQSVSDSNKSPKSVLKNRTRSIYF